MNGRESHAGDADSGGAMRPEHGFDPEISSGCPASETIRRGFVDAVRHNSNGRSAIGRQGLRT
jgi:hypothetical protein